MPNIALAYNPIQPTENDAKLAKESSRVLSKYVSTKDSQPIRIVSDADTSEVINIPSSAFKLLISILAQMSQGNSISLVPINAELSTQQAAELLNVSRPFIIQLTDSNQLSYRKVGSHRRILFSDLMLYKQNIDAQREKVLDQLVAQAQELNLGYDYE